MPASNLGYLVFVLFSVFSLNIRAINCQKRKFALKGNIHILIKRSFSARRNRPEQVTGPKCRSRDLLVSSDEFPDVPWRRQRRRRRQLSRLHSWLPSRDDISFSGWLVGRLAVWPVWQRRQRVGRIAHTWYVHRHGTLLSRQQRLDRCQTPDTAAGSDSSSCHRRDATLATEPETAQVFCRL